MQDSAVRVTNSLVNIRAITTHFSPKIDAWLSQQQLSTPSEDQILEVVKANYDSLTLKLQVRTKQRKALSYLKSSNLGAKIVKINFLKINVFMQTLY